MASGAGAAPDAPLVGFVGLGIMGQGMARNLIASGRRLLVWNRSAAKCDALAELGAEVASSPRQVAEQCGTTYAMLTDPEVARAVHLDERNGTLYGLGAGRALVECSTLDAETMREFASAARGRGGRFLEAPVSGSKVPAEQGALIFMCAGDRDVYDAVADNDLDAMGKAARYYGAEVGRGTHMKLAVNMIMGGMMACAAEGASLVRSVGLPPGELSDILDMGAMSNPMFSLKLPKVARGEFEPNFPLKHQQKDMRLALQLADEHAQPLPVSASANELYKSARQGGLGDLDFSAVTQTLRAGESADTDAAHDESSGGAAGRPTAAPRRSATESSARRAHA